MLKSIKIKPLQLFPASFLSAKARANKSQARPRPGIFYGRYPTKEIKNKSPLTALIKAVLFSGKNMLTKLSNEETVFINEVKSYDKVFAKMNDALFDAWIKDTRKKLNTQGLTAGLMAKTFATIREVSRREIGMAHFDCQLIAGRIMMQGKVAEMQTGEGKTLTATLPAACAAMAGIPVHVITANDYLVERDLGIMAPVYQRLGLSSHFINADSDDEQRRRAYNGNITYCTGQQLTFDYLKDRIQLKHFSSETEFKLASLYSDKNIHDALLMRGLNFALIDEADSVLIDEARTPLILSQQTDDNVHESLNREAVWLARQLKLRKHFNCERKTRSIEITHDGEVLLETLSVNMHGVWKGKRRRIALVSQALSALYNFKRDVDYIVLDEKIVIIDENTGRSMPDRSWEAGLHQMIEEKEGCEQSGVNETIARISYQRFFARYHRLAGMTGTASEVRSELSSVYDLSTATIATNKPSLRLDLGEVVYATHEDKWQAVADCVAAMHQQHRPILIGTRTLEDSETISQLLTERHLLHKILNAKQNEQEADIVSRAGDIDQIMVATNMAGRGTDIPLTDAAKEAGGLHVICCEKNVSSRIDRQLYGRSARQGDPGSFQAILSLEDDIVQRYFSFIASFLQSFKNNETGVSKFQLLATSLIKVAQAISELNNKKLRKDMTKADEKRDSMMAFSGQNE